MYQFLQNPIMNRNVDSLKKTVLTTALVLVASVAMIGQAVARDLPEIREDVFKVVNSGAYPPFSFVDTDGEILGFDVDIAKALSEKMDVKVEIQTSPWNGIIAALVGGRFDACICSMSHTEERAKVVDFSDSYYSAGLSIWVKDTVDDVNSLEDMAGKRVGSTLGETGNQWAVENGEGKWRNQTFQGLPDMLTALNTGRIDVMVADDVPVYVALRENEMKLKQVDVGELPRFPAAISVQKDKPELLAALNQALEEIKADGTYQSIVDKWIGEGADIQ